MQHLMASQFDSVKRKILIYAGVRVAVVEGYKAGSNRVFAMLHSNGWMDIGKHLRIKFESKRQW